MPLWMFSSVLVSLCLAGDPGSAEIVIKPDPEGAKSAQGSATERVAPGQRLHQEGVLDKLRVQSALRSAREALEQQDFEGAIRSLEAELDAASGSVEFLTTLENAYRGRIAKLLGQGASKEASILAERLRVLSRSTSASPSAKSLEKPQKADEPAASEAQPSASAESEAKPSASSLGSFLKPPSLQKLGKTALDSVRTVIPRAQTAEQSDARTVRAKLDDSVALVAASAPTTELERATSLFEQKQYADALPAYEQAYAVDPIAVQAQRARWGYCLLYVTVNRYNDLIEKDLRTIDAAVWEELQADAKTAQQLAPSIQYTSTVVSAINDRLAELSLASRGATGNVSTATQAYTGLSRASLNIKVAHRGSSGPWQAAETTNFIIYHRDPQLAEEVANLAEQARAYASEIWFQDTHAASWEPKCEMYLYPSSQEYGVSTGVSPESPGHSKVVNSGGQILSRKVMLRMDDPNVKVAVLPHEVAHVVLAGRFGAHTVPRWADEGMAVLTEPTEKQGGHLVNLARTHATGRAFTCAQVMTMQQYPAGERMRDFYAHSVGICRYLVEQHGHDRLVAFLRQALESGNYEAALQQVYGMASFDQLESQFRQYVASLGGQPMIATR